MGVAKFESPFLNQVRSSFRKKQRSLKHRVGNAEFDRVLIETAGDDGSARRERLDVVIDIDPTNLLLMKFNDDRWVWVYARETVRRKTVFEWEFEGRLIDTASALINAVYASILVTGTESGSTRSVELTKAWSNVLHSGPTI